jgi:hypothetical protein
MKFPASVLLALVLIPAESASEPNGCILGANRKTSCKSSSETTKLIRIHDQRGAMSPTR